MRAAIRTGSDFSGVGAMDQAYKRLGVVQEKAFACDMDKYARRNYILNYGTKEDIEILNTEKCKRIDSTYYAGIVNTKLVAPTADDWKFVEEHQEEVARSFSFYYPWDVYKREIPEEPLDSYGTTPPCQAFSLAGKRLGKEDRRGILFFNSLEFIHKNKPKTFWFENVKGLLSHDKVDKSQKYGRTFNEWLNYLGGKSINGKETIFPYEDSVPYHIYYQVLNAKEFGVPQNRERVFIIGIRDDINNNFSFPRPFTLEKRLKDILEKESDFESKEAFDEYMKKYILSDKIIAGFINHADNQKAKGNGFKFKPKNIDKDGSEIANCINARVFKSGIDDNYIIQLNDPVHSNDRIYSDEGISPTLNTMQGGNRQPFVGKKVSQTLDTQCNQGVFTQQKIRRLTPRECFRLMDFPDAFDFSGVSDSQAYKQAGNSICIEPLKLLLEKTTSIILNQIKLL